MQRLVAHREQPIPTVADAGIQNANQFDAFFARLLAKKPAERYETMAEVEADIDRLIAGAPISFAAPGQGNPRKPATSQKDKMIWRVGITAAAAMALLAISTAFAMNWKTFWTPGSHSNQANLVSDKEVQPESDSHLPPRKSGAECAIKNGGDGRAMLVVSSSEFDKNQFETLTHVLDERNVDFVVSSPRYGEGTKEFQMDMRKNWTNTKLASYDPNHFDVVFFIDGDLADLTKKSPKYHSQVKAIFKQSFKHGTNISTIGSAWRIVEEAGYCTCESKTFGSVKLFSTDECNPARLHHVDDDKDIVALVIRSLESAEEARSVESSKSRSSPKTKDLL